MKNERGTVIVYVAVVLGVLLGMAALAVDIGHLYVVRNELQNAADAAALAGAGQLGRMYANMTPAEQLNFDCDNCPEVVAAVKDIASKNTSDNISLGVKDSDIVTGVWHMGSPGYIEDVSHMPYAVQVATRRDGSINGSVGTFFARTFGIQSADVGAKATASLLGISQMKVADVLPVGISYQWFTGNYCGQPIKVYPTNQASGCSGWHTYTFDPPNNNTLSRMIDQWARGTIPTGYVSTADSFNFIGGALGDIYASHGPFLGFYDLYLYMRDKDGGSDPLAWEASVPVYDGDCSNPGGSIRLLGFASVIIKDVIAPPAGKEITATVVCKLIKSGPSGGGIYGLYGTIPKLVE